MLKYVVVYEILKVHKFFTTESFCHVFNYSFEKYRCIDISLYSFMAAVFNYKIG